MARLAVRKCPLEHFIDLLLPLIEPVADYIDDDGHRHRTLTEEEKRLRAERNAAIEVGEEY